MRERAFLKSLIAVLLTTGIYLTSYIATNSLLALAEFLHRALDVLAMAIAWICVMISLKPPDEEHPYGHGKAESIGGFTISMFIIGTCMFIAYESIMGLLKGHELRGEPLVIPALLSALAIDIWRALTLRGLKGLLVEATVSHFVLDASITSLALALTSIAVLTPQYVQIASLIDVFASMAIACLFTYVGVRLLRLSIAELMDTAISGLDEYVRELARGVPGVVDVKDVRTRRIGHKHHIEVTVSVPGHISVAEAHKIIDEVKDRLKGAFESPVVQVHVEPEHKALLKLREDLGLLGIEDFRLLKIDDLNLILIALPRDSRVTQREIGDIVNRHIPNAVIYTTRSFDVSDCLNAIMSLCRGLNVECISVLIYDDVVAIEARNCKDVFWKEVWRLNTCPRIFVKCVE